MDLTDQRTILIVDDEPDCLSAIANALKEVGSSYRIIRAPDGRIAANLALSRQPDLVISDWDMPVMNGIELIKELRTSEVTRDIPVIMCTGVMTTSENLQTALGAGAFDYIRKPVDRIELIARVRSMLRLGDHIKLITSQNAELERLNRELEEKNETIYRQAVTDHLTGLYNRVHMMKELSREFSNSQRHQLPLSCVMLDLDHFKSINDHFGHPAGDLMLKEMADLVAGSIRSGDTACRYGGEEFLLVLPNTSIDSALTVAEKIRLSIKKARIRFQGSELSVTASVGVADNQRGRPSSGEQMLHNADRALYLAKAGGRDQVVVFDPKL